MKLDNIGTGRSHAQVRNKTSNAIALVNFLHEITFIIDMGELVFIQVGFEYNFHSKFSSLKKRMKNTSSEKRPVKNKRLSFGHICERPPFLLLPKPPVFLQKRRFKTFNK